MYKFLNSCSKDLSLSFNTFSGLIIVPSRELAKQIKDNIDYICKFTEADNLPEIRTCLAIGGEPVATALQVIRK